MNLINEKIPEATVISVGHRPELEAFHERKLVLKHQTGGARLIRDEYLTFIPGPHAHLVRKFKDWRRRKQDRGQAPEAAQSHQRQQADISASIVGHEDTRDISKEKEKAAQRKKPEPTGIAS